MPRVNLAGLRAEMSQQDFSSALKWSVLSAEQDAAMMLLYYALGFIFVVCIYLFLYLSVYMYHWPALPLLLDYFSCCRYLNT
jgi:hypothetical protein